MLDENRKIENLRKMFLAVSKDLNSVVQKLAQRVHEIKDKETAMETLDIYAPLANRLGMGEIKTQLEDLAFPFVYPQEYKTVKNLFKNKYGEKEKEIIKIKYQLTEELKNNGIKDFEINSRVKHLYSLFKKLQRPDINMNIDLVNDLIALRIIVDNIEDCYRVMGIIHKTWKPLSEKFKDFIAIPKPNNYQSIHTTIFTEKEKIVEIQIRTKEMHEYAEHGVAAHWVYDETGKPKNAGKSYKHFSWAKDLQNRVFCFTPKGDVIDLPEGATAIDFAYAIHAEIGNQAIGTTINNKFVSLNSVLRNGDIVEIKTQKSKKPSLEWLKHAKTSLARKQIKLSLKKEDKVY